jgi:16S rRNA (cytosine1402-N4)-methyltransferase
MKTENKKQNKATLHKSVLLQNVIEVLDVKPTDTVLDGTLGGGGHMKAILKLLGEDGRYFAIDADESAIQRVLEDEEVAKDKRVAFFCGNFRNMDKFLNEANISEVDKILLDIGLSSDQLEARSERGFSFQIDEPLKMTFNLSPEKGELTAWHVVNEWSEENLADVIYGFGGERKSRKIARAICEAREEREINTSKELAHIIEMAVSKRKGVHPATKTFQAIRMAVNDELGALEEALAKSKTLLSSEGRIAVISFHSLEDRIVKKTFLEWEKEGTGKRITKKPLTASREECKENPRARSAKLRCFEKTQ